MNLSVARATRAILSPMGLAKNFKKRYGKHKKCLDDEFAEGHTCLTTHYWKEKNAGNNPVVTWKYLERNVPDYNPVAKTCRLCLREKFNIVLRPSLASLNSRQEIFGHCRHMRFKLIKEEKVEKINKKRKRPPG